MKGSRFSEGADHRSAARAGGRREDRRGMPAARDLERDVLQVEAKYGGLEVSEARRLKALEDENRRLKSCWPSRCWTTRRSRTCSEKTSEACGAARKRR